MLGSHGSTQPTIKKLSVNQGRSIGNAPKEGCNADRSSTEVAVLYTTDYYFYGVAKRKD